MIQTRIITYTLSHKRSFRTNSSNPPYPRNPSDSPVSETPDWMREEREAEHARIFQAYNDTYDALVAHDNVISEWQAEHPGEQIPEDMAAENRRLYQARWQAANDWDLEDQEISSESSYESEAEAEAEAEVEPDQDHNNHGEEPRGTKRSRGSGDDEGPSNSKFPKGPEDGPGGPGGSSGHGTSGGGSSIPISSSGNVGYSQLCEDIIAYISSLEYIAYVYNSIYIFIFLVPFFKACFSAPGLYIFTFVIRPYIYCLFSKYIALPVKVKIF